MLHVREYDEFHGHLRSLFQIPRIVNSGNWWILVSDNPKPPQEQGLDAFKKWVNETKLEVLEAQRALSPVIVD